MNPIFYTGGFVAFVIVFAFPLLRSMFEHFTDCSRRELVDMEARFEKAARERDEWKRKCDAALTLAEKYKAELKALQEHHNATLPSLQ